MHKQSRTDRWLRTGLVLFLVTLVLLIIFNGTTKTSDVSNWIIAFANIAMAAAAVGAWRAARKFLSEFFAQEGYRLAIALINENVIHLGLDNEFTVCVSKAIMICERLDGREHTESNNVDLGDALNKLKTLHEYHNTWLRNCRSLSFRMETYGIYAAEDKKEALTGMILALDSMVRHGKELISLLAEDFNHYDQKVKTRSNLFMPFKSEHLTKMQEIFKAINVEWNLMVSSRNLLLSEGKHARTLFVVRDS